MACGCEPVGAKAETRWNCCSAERGRRGVGVVIVGDASFIALSYELFADLQIKKA
jgi:hypothetical protein